jgi:hypothetical protein
MFKGLWQASWRQSSSLSSVVTLCCEAALPDNADAKPGWLEIWAAGLAARPWLARRPGSQSGSADRGKS